jgi:signal transduction histidine kinase
MMQAKVLGGLGLVLAGLEQQGRAAGVDSMRGSWLFVVICVAIVVVLLAWLRTMRLRIREQVLVGQRERAMREELEAYARLDGTLSPGDSPRPLAMRVCRAVAEKSAFRKVAMLVRDAEGKLYVAASAGMDDLTVVALGGWGEDVVRREGGLGPGGPDADLRPDRLGRGCFVLRLGTRGGFDDRGLDRGVRTPEDCRRVIVTLLRGQSGIILGALAVCAEELLDERPGGMMEALPPLETLAMKIARTLENASLNERLMRVEKLAGLGQLAGGVAHELNNPLTAVLGFAELIKETSSEERVRQDAETILLEAQRMRETVQSLLQFWRPVAEHEKPVDLSVLLTEVALACEGKLESRGVRLVLQIGRDLPPVSGNRDRLRQVLEHLLNNAAQAIASSQERRRSTDVKQPTDWNGAEVRQGGHALAGEGLPTGADEGDLRPAIRLTASCDARTIHLIVSDTGPGFGEPARAFDPFYTTRQPGGGSGLGLSICYGIVREHGGEIAAFNLHPHGAAVVVELPVRKTIAEDSEESVLVRSGSPSWGSGSWSRSMGGERRKSRA